MPTLGFFNDDYWGGTPLAAPVVPPSVAAGPDVLRSGMAWQSQWLKTTASETIVYARGYDSVELQATLGQKLLKLDDGEGGFLITLTDMDFLVLAADLVFDGEPVIPEPGDLVYLTVIGGTEVQTFEVVNYGGTEAAWRWTDRVRTTVRDLLGIRTRRTRRKKSP